MNLSRTTPLRSLVTSPSKTVPAFLQKDFLFNPALKFLILMCLFTLPPASSQAAEKSRTPPTRSEVAEKKGDLKDLRGQIKTLRKEISSAEDKRASVADQLKTVEQEISTTQRELHTLTRKGNTLQTTLKDLGAQSRDLENRLNSQQNQLKKFVYRQYLQGNPDSLQIMLNGDDPNQLARDLYYLAAIGRARSQLLHDIERSLQRKQALAADTRERAQELTAIEAKQKQEHVKLVTQREQRKQVMVKISAQISQQQREIGNLQRDEKQLSQLIDRLAKMLAAKPAVRKEAKPAPGKSPSGKTPTPGISNENSPEAMPAGHFAQLKGRLRLPVRGVVTNRFGGARQEGSVWKGLFIRAGQGGEVKAIAGGAVVFADWMRGFGNIIIVDHGNSYLSIYGNNEAVLKQVGERVNGGDTIASVGNSGGNPESGLYFELRHQGQPLDPLKWVNLK